MGIAILPFPYTSACLLTLETIHTFKMTQSVHTHIKSSMQKHVNFLKSQYLQVILEIRIHVPDI